MFISFIDSGLVVHVPLGPRKSGMPDSVLIPAPVRTAIRSAAATWAPTSATEPADRSVLMTTGYGDLSSPVRRIRH